MLHLNGHADTVVCSWCLFVGGHSFLKTFFDLSYQDVETFSELCSVSSQSSDSTPP